MYHTFILTPAKISNITSVDLHETLPQTVLTPPPNSVIRGQPFLNGVKDFKRTLRIHDLNKIQSELISFLKESVWVCLQILMVLLITAIYLTLLAGLPLSEKNI